MNENTSASSVLRADFRGTRERGAYRCLVTHLGVGMLGARSEVKCWSLSHVRLSATPRTTQFMKFSRPEYWSG